MRVVSCKRLRLQHKEVIMAKARDYKKEYQRDLQTGKSGPGSAQSERQRARHAFDAKGIDRSGKDIDHIKPLRKGGKSTPGNLRLRSKSANQGDNK